ncbi:MAG: hypothetical protein FJZ63_04235, partial [Chlamydiae bacterium]|nr:hypothetical protein [Chlamydiota bacterium]
KAWCDNLEKYCDCENRLPRGRSYVRNGSVIDLNIQQGLVQAQVMGSSLYHVTIKVTHMAENKWKKLIQECAGKIDSLVELLQGKFSKAIMSILVDPKAGFFPSSSDLTFTCSCPDHAGLCKHIAAAFYGIGAAIDTKPEWLFKLRHVDHLQLLAVATSTEKLFAQATPSSSDEELTAIFDIELADDPSIKKKKQKR